MKRWSLPVVVALAATALLSSGAAGPVRDLPPLPCDRTVNVMPVLADEGTPGVGKPATTPFTFTVTADDCDLAGATVSYATDHVTTGTADLTPASGTLTWSPGDTTARQVTVWVTKDAVSEPHERFVVKFCPVAGGSAAAASGWILNDDRPTPAGETVPYNYHCRQ